MSLNIQTNVSSLYAHQSFLTNQASLNATFNQLSTGYSINSAADVPVGLSVGSMMSFQASDYSAAVHAATVNILTSASVSPSNSPLLSLLG